MPVSYKPFLKFENNVSNVTKLLKTNQTTFEPDESNTLASTLISIAGIAASVAIPFLAPASLGLAGVILAEVISFGVDVGSQYAISKINNVDLPISTIGITAAASLFSIGSAVKASKFLKGKTASINELSNIAVNKSFTSQQRQVLLENVDQLATRKLSTKAVNQKLIRAGLTSDESLEVLVNAANTLKKNGVNTSKRIFSEIDFIKQETAIFKELGGAAKKIGFELNDVFDILSNSGIDVVGVKSSTNLARKIRASPIAQTNLKKVNLFTPLQGAIQRDLEPSLFTKVFNANMAEKQLNKVNKLISLTDPNQFINEVADKIFKPIKTNIDNKLINPFKKKTAQKLKHMLRQDVTRKLETKNGVYPCFGSGWVNYLRSLPLGNGLYQCRVIFRKWGYTPVLISTTFKLSEIINWSESSSPGRIYHGFRRQFGKKKNSENIVDPSSFDGNLSSIFNLLGFIPDKYISLGVSLISNIARLNTAAAIDTWSDFLANPYDDITNILNTKAIDSFGGQIGTAATQQLKGERSAISNYLKGQVETKIKSRESYIKQGTNEGKSKLD